MKTLVLGARGGLGSLVCAELVARGHSIHTVTRREARDADALAGTGCGAIVDCAGASVGFGKGWRGYRAVDTPIGVAAAEAACRLGVRMVYVGVAHPPAMASCAYVDAHERVVHAMRDVDGVVVRATGFFSAFRDLAAMADKRGVLVDIGRGDTRTNPIDERDLAAIVAEAVVAAGLRAGGAGLRAGGDHPRELAAGGPEVMTRAEIFDRIAAVVSARRGVDGDRRVRIVRLPVWLGASSAAMLRVVHPRLGQFAKFAALLARHDVIADALGTRTLADYLAAPLQRAA